MLSERQTDRPIRRSCVRLVWTEDAAPGRGWYPELVEGEDPAVVLSWKEQLARSESRRGRPDNAFNSLGLRFVLGAP